MPRKYKVISADGHVETPPESWTKYVPERWRARAPRLIKIPEGGEAWVVEGQPLLHNGQNITGGGPVKFAGGTYFAEDGGPGEGAGDAVQRLREQDKDGVDAEVLFPPVFATRFIEGIKDREPYRAMVSAYNRFLAEDYCSVAPDRLIGNGVIPVSGIEDALTELDHLNDLGLSSVSLHQFPNGSGFAKPEDDRFYEKAMELGIRLSPHINMGHPTPPPVGAESVGTAAVAFASSLTGRGGDNRPMYCLAQLIAAGVFDRFPEIKFYFAETNASWLPVSLFFMDDNYKTYQPWFQVKLKRLPSEYILEHVYFGIIRDPLALHADIPMDHIMWGSDFPHSVGSYPKSQEFLEGAFEGVDPKIREEILLTTPASYFGLDLDADLTETPA